MKLKQKIGTRWAGPGDLDWCAGFDHHVPRGVIEHKIAAQEIVIAAYDGQPIGYLRLEYLWSIIPYIAIIHVLPDYQRQGIGRAILAFVESEMLSRGCETLMSSSQVDEPEPQAWHRHMGFVECGILAGINPGGVGEVFFRKVL
ncbi:MAG: GNAT family N-acetyltransferase [Chloroflexi bacterium]|nr:GNAT family N-acetyltransferase [Chloroflexota bacterium]